MGHTVLVYGSLKKGKGNSHYLANAKFLGETHVAGKMYSLGGFPGVRLDEPGSVKCEVYEVDELTLRRLDKLEGYRGTGDGNFYDRLPTRFSLGDKSMVGEIYQIGKDFTSNRAVVESGDW